MSVRTPSDDPDQPEHGVGQAPVDWPTGRLLSAAARRMERAWDAYLARWNLNHASVSALAIVSARPCSQRELAAAHDVTEQTIGRVVAGLLRHGYVERRRDPTDARRWLVVATDAGRGVLRALDEPDVIDGLVDHGLDAEQERRLRELLVRFL